jgi:hypothetical protein
MASTKSVLVILTFLATASIGNGNAFLKKDVNGTRKALAEAAIEKRFLEEVRGITGKGPADKELATIRSALEPMWASLPKNSYDRLDQAQVKYALHRLFVQRHGWYIDGLDGVSSNETMSTPAGIMREKVPTFLFELFEQALGSTGLKMHELVVFAGTLERLIHDEMVDRLKDVYKALGVSADSRMSEDDAQKAMKAFMYQLITKKDLADEQAVQDAFLFLDKVYPAWGKNQQWLVDIRRAAVPEVTEEGYSFAQMETATEQVSMQLGGFVGEECKRMKDALIEVDEQDTGRVMLSKFYKKGIDAGFHFVEKADYLRRLGALDDSQPGEARLILPNFMLSPNNCLVDNGFYSVCCLNECESVMGELEKKIGAPQATPERIASVISSIGTSTVSAPRTLPEKMLARLDMVAERTGGEVPLYGRLFSQWLHFAFPRECPYPHTTGSTTPMAPSDYLTETAERSSMSWKELQQYVKESGTTSAEEESSEAVTAENGEEALLQQWLDEEEIFFLPVEAAPSALGKLLRCSLYLAVISFVLIALIDTAKRFGCTKTFLGKVEKSHLV